MADRLGGDGNCFLMIIAAGTGISGLGGIKVAGFNLGGWMWVLSFVVSALHLAGHHRYVRIRFSYLLWLPWLIYVAWTTDFSDRDAVQRLGILTTPVLVATAASASYTLTLNGLRRTYFALFAFALGTYIFAAAASSSLEANAEWYVPEGTCMTFTLLAIAAVADCGHRVWHASAIWLVSLVVLAFTTSRMPLLVLPTLAVFGPSPLQLRHRTVLAVCVMLGGLAFFETSAIQNNLFRSGSGSIVDLFALDPSELRTGGRLYAWTKYYDGMKDIWFGQGSIASAHFGGETFGSGKWAHPHNEFIRVIFDYGLVGGVLLAVPLTAALSACARLGQSRHSGARWMRDVCIGGLLAMLLLSVTGNVLMYVAWFGNLLFATIGLAKRAEALRPGKGHRRTPLAAADARLSSGQQDGPSRSSSRLRQTSFASR